MQPASPARSSRYALIGLRMSQLCRRLLVNVQRSVESKISVYDEEETKVASSIMNDLEILSKTTTEWITNEFIIKINRSITT
jgi:hypothetical protein